MHGIKDIIHGFIPLDEDMLKIIDTPIFQRLGRIKQLTSAEYVFPGARHSRKEHCIGAMFLATKYARALKLNEHETKVIAVAALLHDIGHGPYSHGYDASVYSLIYPGCHKGHDKHRYAIVKSFLKNILIEIGLNVEEIFEVWNNKNLVLSAILQSALSVDRLDFIARDTLYTATTHFGFMEIDRIINHSSICIKPDTLGEGTEKRVLAFSEKIITDVVQGLNSRLHMYNEVYLNKTVIAASCLIEAAIKEATPYLDFVERTLNMDRFIYLNDSIMDEILQSTDPDLEKARYYARRLYHRDLPKLLSEEIIYLSPKSKIEHEGGIIYSR